MALAQQMLGQKIALISYCLLKDLSSIQVKVPALVTTQFTPWSQPRCLDRRLWRSKGILFTDADEQWTLNVCSCLHWAIRPDA